MLNRKRRPNKMSGRLFSACYNWMEFRSPLIEQLLEVADGQVRFVDRHTGLRRMWIGAAGIHRVDAGGRIDARKDGGVSVGSEARTEFALGLQSFTGWWR